MFLDHLLGAFMMAFRIGFMTVGELMKGESESSNAHSGRFLKAV